MIQTIPCRLCQTPTTMLDTKLCDRCRELESRMQADPEITYAILQHLDTEKFLR